MYVKRNNELISKYKEIIKKENFIAIVLSGAAALIFMFNSPLHPWSSEVTLIDSSVFKTVALMMENGYMPYRDSFDHKGPFLYLLNYCGNRISEYRGVWVIEVFTLSITFFMMYKIARLSCQKVAAVVTTLTASSLLFGYFAGGNFSEEYAMPCIAVSLYFFLDYLINEYTSRLRLVICGVSFGIVLMLRPNMIAAWIVFCTAIIIVLRKTLNTVLTLAKWFVGGMLMIIIPIIFWLIINNDFYYFYMDYISFNILYSSVEGGRATFSAKWVSFFAFFNTTVIIIAFLSNIIHLNYRKNVSISYLIYMIMSIVLSVMSGMHYEHYGMILVPATVWPISLIFYDIEKIKEKDIKKLLMILVSIYLLCSIVLPNWINIISSIPEKFENRNEVYRDEDIVNILNLIEEHTDETEKISVYGNWDVIYVLSHRMHATRYSYQFPIGEVNPYIMDEYMDSLQKELPKLIVIGPDNNDDNIQMFLEKNNYTSIYDSRARLFIRE